MTNKKILKKINRVAFVKPGVVMPDGNVPDGLLKAWGVDWIVEIPDESYVYDNEVIKKELEDSFDQLIEDYYSLPMRERTKIKLRTMLQNIIKEEK